MLLRKLSENDDMIIALCTVNYNPLSHKIMMCPPEDGRSPFMIRAYNKVIAQVAHRSNIPFFDMQSSVIGPIWDTASDWCHYEGKGFRAELLFRLCDIQRGNQSTRWMERTRIPLESRLI